jgi:tRNA threonylcarbamoyladenosine modification (KEOPS) complex  Pcc1 subunit
MILESIAAVLSGGATGIFGSLITDVSSHFANKSKYEFELKKGELDIKVIEAEAAASARVAESELQRAMAEADAKTAQTELQAFIAAEKSDGDIISAISAAKSPSKLVNTAAFIRTMVRPILTLYLCLISTIMYLDASNALERIDTNAVAEQTLVVYSSTTNNVLYLTSAAVLFWFGQRKKKD